MKASTMSPKIAVLCALLVAGCGGGGGRTPQTGSFRSFSTRTYAPGVALTVTVHTVPDQTTEYYAIEDDPPVGWTVSAISDSGTFDAVNNKVKWGPFADNTARDLTYTLTPPSGASGTQAFDGDLSMDGGDTVTAGSSSIGP